MVIIRVQIPYPSFMIQIDFPEGKYSQHKDSIKQVFKILDYKYSFGKSNLQNQLICIWKRKEDNSQIKAIFNGSGKSCQFIIKCPINEYNVFESFIKTFDASSVIEIQEEQNNKISDESLKLQAKQLVDKWFISQTKTKLLLEPEYFYLKRIEKEKQDYLNHIEIQYQKLKEQNI